MILKMNLQLFSDGEKTEKPSPKKRRDAREEGQILQSKEINTVVVIFSCFFGLKLFGGFMNDQLSKFMVDIFGEINNIEVFFNLNNLMPNFLQILTILLIVSAPILVVAFLLNKS